MLRITNQVLSNEARWQNVLLRSAAGIEQLLEVLVKKDKGKGENGTRNEDTREIIAHRI